MPSKRQNSQPQNRRKSSQHDEPSLQNLFVACLPREVNNDSLLELFAPFNAVSATVMLNVVTGKSKGFGFVVFDRDEDGDAAMNYYADRVVNLSGVPPFTMHISPSKFNGKTILMESPYIFLRNIPSTLPKYELRHFLKRFGNVLRIQRKEDDQSNGGLLLLMVQYSTVDEAKEAIHSCHGFVLFPELSTVPVLAKFADASTVKNQTRKSRAAANRSPALSSIDGATTPSSQTRSPSHTPQHGGIEGFSLDQYQFPAVYNRTPQDEETDQNDTTQVFNERVMEELQLDAGVPSALGAIYPPRALSTVALMPILGAQRNDDSRRGSEEWNSAYTSPTTKSARKNSLAGSVDQGLWFRNDPYKEEGVVVVQSPPQYELNQQQATGGSLSSSGYVRSPTLMNSSLNKRNSLSSPPAPVY